VKTKTYVNDYGASYMISVDKSYHETSSFLA